METQPLNQEIVDKFKVRKKRQILATIPIVAAFVLMIWLEEASVKSLGGLSSEQIMMIIFALIVAMLIFTFRNWRCPGCQKYLGKRINPRFCSHCGVQLRD